MLHRIIKAEHLFFVIIGHVWIIIKYSIFYFETGFQRCQIMFREKNHAIINSKKLEIKCLLQVIVCRNIVPKTYCLEVPPNLNIIHSVFSFYCFLGIFSLLLKIIIINNG